ncbi:hypothetical protein [Acidithiobacillus thiooxidans]|uniref:hypothetical protein n=1 Tax=Acidithiobacillus thiooxidans TaxID=930 RepID=UPI001C0704C8|nr:hypothetical protein [Acidithiobacillus thiooxidans]MBU2843549.1 hypothetical protein [Acidithiobacillus thiooxidans]
MAKSKEQFKKQLIIAHGEKGGVGKSMFSMLAVDYLINKNDGRKIAIVEGDLSVSDVATRYDGVEGITGYGVDIDKSGRDAENAIAMLFDNLEENDSDSVILNAPANAAKSLDVNAELILPVAQSLGYEVCVAFMIGLEAASGEMSKRSVICKLADRKLAVVNRRESSEDHEFAWFSNPEYQAAWAASGGILGGELPNLASRAASQMKDHQGRTMVSLSGPDSPLKAVYRQMIKDWLIASWQQAVIPLIEPELLETGNDNESVGGE